MRETLGKPYPTEVGNTRALVPVPHRAMPPGQRTEGLQHTGKPASPLRGSAWSTFNVRPPRFSPLGGSAIYWSWPMHHAESIPRGVSTQKMLAFFTEH